MNKWQRFQILAAMGMMVLGAVGANADIVTLPDPLVLDELTDTAFLVVDYTGGGSANLFGYSLEFQWDHTLATAVFSRPDNEAFSGAVTFFVVPIADGHVRIDAAIGGSDPGITEGELFKVEFTAVPLALGTSSIDLTIVHLRDPDNQDLVTLPAVVDGFLDVDMLGAPSVENVLIVNNTLGHTNDFVKDTDAITVTANVTDNDPGFDETNIEADLSQLGGSANAAPDSYVAPVATWTFSSVACSPADGELIVTVTATDDLSNMGSNTDTIIADNTAPAPLLGAAVTPGHEQLHLAWNDIGDRDANPLGVEFRFTIWGDYPAYDSAAPAYPADHNDGALALQAETGTTADWPTTPRDIYYVSGFVYDMALNYGANDTENQGRATNYWLGDVDGPGSVVDGIVDVVNDITRLGDTYGLPDTDGAFDPVCDVGPTDTGSPRGIPEPNVDNEVGFEDMMVFALNWSVVTPSTKDLIGGTPVLAWRQVDDLTWALNLMDKGGDLQGLNLRAEMPDGVQCTVTAGDLLAEQEVPVFLRNIPQHGVDAGLALFGRGAGFSGSGELVRVTLSKPVDDLQAVVTARDADNKDLGVEVGTDNPSAVPTVASFSQNYPNPFNPRTTLAFELPDERQVQLAVFALDGTRVRTLVDGVRGAGRHEISWDGRDDSGRSVAAGTYFARVSAGDLKQIRKMVLVK